MSSNKSLDAEALPLGAARMVASGDAAKEEEKKMEANGSDESSSATSNASSDEDPESPKESASVSGEQDESDKPEPTIRNSQARGCELSSLVISDLDKLPPLPQPRDDILRQEKKSGIAVVFTAVAVCLFLTHYVALTVVLPSENLDDDGEILQENPYETGKIVFLALIYAEAVAAIICTTGIKCADPCEVKRSEETCNPLPKRMESWVIHSPTEPRPLGLEHYLRGADQRTYCTKCLVWRKPAVTHFHCAICQRCCAYHDHHCNVFGRCIAGNLKFWESSPGNRLYFYGLLVSGAWAYFTACVAFLYAFSVRYRPAYAIPIGISVMILLSCCCFNNGPVTIAFWPLIKFLRICKRCILHKNS